ncbi:MAG: 30S ribosome-binding factor RbfA [Steroidobacteraceae bacterium]
MSFGQQGTRRERLAEGIKRALAEKLGRGLSDPRIKQVTLTAVDMAPDLKSARVYFVPFGGHEDAAQVAAGLNSAAGHLRGELGREMRIKHAPRLHFVVDETIDRADRLTRLIAAATAADQHGG